MNPESMMHRLIALRATVDSMIAELTVELAPKVEPEDGGDCSHENTKDVSTMGKPRRQCLDCGSVEEIR